MSARVDADDLTVKADALRSCLQVKYQHPLEAPGLVAGGLLPGEHEEEVG